MARSIQPAIDAMSAALATDGGPPELIAKLAKIKDSAYYCPPEGMDYWWHALCYEFNCAAFGSDKREWDRDRTPAWAQRAGRILAGEES